MHPWWLLFLPAAAYQCLALFAILRYARTSTPRNGFQPAVSVLKPVLGLDPNTLDAFRSQANQHYPEFELLFAVRDLTDPAVPAIRQLAAEFPKIPIQLIEATTGAPNGKVASLIDLSKAARHPVWVINDGDIAVSPHYLSEVVAPLANPEIGVVTCPYRAWAHSSPTRWEALGIASDFMPSTMVAQLLGVRDFGFGSTLAFRAQDLQNAGGFEALSDYLADDFQLAHRIALTGKRAVLSRHTVETSLGEGTWSGIWHHQLRWARTIRRSKGAGYAGLPIIQAGLWSLIALCAGAWQIALLLLALRIASAFAVTTVLRARQSLRICWLSPLWDVYAFVIWIGAWTGNTVRWRNRTLYISPDGKIRK